MLIIPAIDLKDGECVRLRQGLMDDSTVFSVDPVSVAQRWVDAGCRRLHLVDLNGAFAGEPMNGEVVTAIAAAYPNLPIQIGGGIRTLDTIEHYIKAGGLLVDSVTEVMRIAEDTLLPASGGEADAVESLCARGDTFVSLIDLERVLEFGSGG